MKKEKWEEVAKRISEISLANSSCVMCFTFFLKCLTRSFVVKSIHLPLKMFYHNQKCL